MIFSVNNQCKTVFIARTKDGDNEVKKFYLYKADVTIEIIAIDFCVLVQKRGLISFKICLSVH